MRKEVQFLLSAVLNFVLLVSTSAWCSEVFIDQDMLNIDKICKEENLTQKKISQRVYIFLAVLNGNRYDTYAARGDSDLDKDGKNVLQEPNNLAGYVKIGSTDANLSFSSDDHTCYITKLPKFEELFPNEENPFSGHIIVGVPTEAKENQKFRLTGSKTLPLITNDGASLGIERFVAFYNKKGLLASLPAAVVASPSPASATPATSSPAAAKPLTEDEKNQVVSFGFMAIRINDSE